MVICKGDCSYGLRYIGETKRNAKVKQKEHNQPKVQNHETPSKQHEPQSYLGCKNLSAPRKKKS